MSEEKKEVFKLFKIAKELNVASSTLVEHLAKKGFQVKNTLNEKLSVEMYSLLLKDFAPDKAMKEKVDLIREQKKEARIVHEEVVVDEDSPISAEQLRSSLLEGKSSATTEKATAKKKTTIAKKFEAPPVEKIEEKPPVVEAPVPEKDDSGIKVIGKIDLSQFNKKKKTDPKEAKEKATKEKKTAKSAKTPPETPAKEEKPSKKKEKAPPVTEGIISPEIELPQVDSEPKEEEKAEVIRASDTVPRLSGLRVMGKINLPEEKKAKKKETPAASEEDADKKKRKRKRKRKNITQVNTAVAVKQPRKGEVKKGKPDEKAKKDDLTEKEIQEKIKSTLAELNKKAGRVRQRLRRGKREEAAHKREAELIREAEDSKVLEATEFITAHDLASMIGLPVTDIISKCMELGLFVSINQRLEADMIQLLAEEYGYTVKFVDATETIDEEEEEEEDPENLKPRAPIVTVMGHVDHGKTSLLDYLRKTNVVAGEAGGITQHIGAYQVLLEDGRAITFLDTPGHEAFTAMRARGAKITDVVVIVVAADDNVMPQTKEAINHAQAAGVPMVFAINKIDKPNSNPDKIREQLSAYNILVEDWGGKYQVQNISAKQGLNVKDLLEKVMIEAEMLDLKSNPVKPARGTVIEAELDKGRGNVATVLVQDGNVKVGDCLVAGIHFGKVKALLNERGERVKDAGPSTPVQVLGIGGRPNAGDSIRVYPDERKAKEVATRLQNIYREQTLRKTKHITLEEIARRKAIGDFRELNLIVKGDVDGSVEALSDSLLKISTEEVKVNILMKGVGQITESDVNLAVASEAIIIGFQVRPSTTARKLAENEEIDIRLYSIIYDAINDVTDALEGLLQPELKEEIMGQIEIRELFKIPKVGTVAGCMVIDGRVYRNDPIRLIRDGIVIFGSKLSSLKRFKDDVKDVAQGFECGLTVDNYNDIKVGDIVESYRTSEVKRTLS